MMSKSLYYCVSNISHAYDNIKFLHYGTLHTQLQILLFKSTRKNNIYARETQDTSSLTHYEMLSVHEWQHQHRGAALRC